MLTLFVGPNGVGKSFLLVNCFCLSLIARGVSDPNVMELAQFIYDRSFTDQNINGIIKIDFKDCWMSITFDRGKITNIDSDITDQVIAPVSYMSSSMRLFSSISTYLKMRKRLTGSDEEILNEMSLDYKLYDVIYIENLIKKCPITITDQITTQFNQFINDSIIGFDVDLQKCDFIVATQDGVKYLTNYSNGEQSIINMIIANT